MGRGGGQAHIDERIGLLFGNVSGRRSRREVPQPGPVSPAADWSRISQQLRQYASDEQWRQPPSVQTSAYFSAQAYQKIKDLRFLAVSENYYEDDYGFELVIAANPQAERADYQVLLIGERMKAAIVTAIKMPDGTTSTHDLAQAVQVGNQAIDEQSGRWQHRRRRVGASIRFDLDQILAGLADE